MSKRTHTVGRDNMFWFDYDNLKISGWSYYVNEGDIVRSEMQSGKVGLFKITKLKRMLEPKDQYFAEVKPWRYENE